MLGLNTAAAKWIVNSEADDKLKIVTVDYISRKSLVHVRISAHVRHLILITGKCPLSY